MPASNTAVRVSIQSHFPEALAYPMFRDQIFATLREKGFAADNTLFASALCRDELNAHIARDFADEFGENFNLAGLAGYPGAGVTGVGACLSHVPDGGRMLLIGGPHIGIDASGSFGQQTRPGKEAPSATCGAVAKLIGAVAEDAAYQPSPDPLDAEQEILEKTILGDTKALEAIQGKGDKAEVFVATTRVLGDIIARQLKAIVARFPNYEIHLILGIVINTPTEMDDYIVPYVVPDFVQTQRA